MTAASGRYIVQNDRRRWWRLVAIWPFFLWTPAAGEVVHVPHPVRIEVDAGSEEIVTVDLQGPRYEDVRFAATWHSAPAFDGIEVLLGAGDHFTGDRWVEVVYPRTGTGRPLTLKVKSDHCCSSFDGDMALQVDRLTPDASVKGPVHSLLIPVELRARRSWLACWSSLLALGWFAGMAVMWYRNSYFIDIDPVTLRLQAMEKREQDGFIRPRSPLIGPSIKKALSPSRRALAWLRANPFLIALPGQRYYEALELDFRSGWPLPILTLRSVRNLPDRIGFESAFTGRLFFIGDGRLISTRSILLGRTDARGQISELEVDSGTTTISGDQLILGNQTLHLRIRSPDSSPSKCGTKRSWRISKGG